MGLERMLKEYSAPTPIQSQAHPLPGGRDDLMKMLGVCPNMDQRTLVTLTGLCGARINEALKVRPGDVDLQARRIRILGKGDHERFVPLGNTALNNLAEPVLLATIHRRDTLLNYAERSARLIITVLGERAGISRPVASHDMRATFATEVYETSGYNIELVRRLLGHRNLTYTQQYLGVGAQALAAAVNFMEEES